MGRLAADSYRRRTLQRVEDQILRETGNHFERLILLDADGRPLWVKDGWRDGVELTAEEVQRWRGKADLVTHNHPTSLSFTVGDLLASIALGVRELNAFASTLRYRLLVKASGAWPVRETALEALKEIDERIRALIEPRVTTGALSPQDALALHRHTRWTLFAQRFAADVDYVVEDR